MKSPEQYDRALAKLSEKRSRGSSTKEQTGYVKAVQPPSGYKQIYYVNHLHWGTVSVQITLSYRREIWYNVSQNK